MNIGIDVDGVLTDMGEYCCMRGEQLLGRPPIDKTAKKIENMFDITKREKMMYGGRLFFNYCKHCPPREKVAEIFDKLKSKGHELHIITARRFITRKNPMGIHCRRVLKNWFEKHKIRPDSLNLCSWKDIQLEKHQGCLKVNARIMIEDNVDTAIYLAKRGIKVFLFDTLYNRDLEGENIVRVTSWQDIYDKIVLDN